jgi:N6-adenosine-specific RNA methylase IME4
LKVDIFKTKKKYHVIYEDPPYMFKNKKTGGGMKSGSSSKYITMTTDEICNLPIKKISHKNAVLYLWVPVPLIEDGLRIMREQGFKYKTFIAWRKVGSGGWGFWYRGELEILLFGIKGKVKAFRSKRTNYVEHRRMGHSVKPDIFREIVEESTVQFGKNKKMIELFARKHPEKKFYQKKWDYFGDNYK